MMFTVLSLFGQTALAFFATEANSVFLFYSLYSRSHFQEIPAFAGMTMLGEIPAFAGRTVWRLEVGGWMLEI
jgi:hypothetical protein